MSEAPSEPRPWLVDEINLRREGDYAVVSVLTGGEWREVIRELADGCFDHYAVICNWSVPA